MAEEAKAFKDEATKEIEQFLIEQVQLAVSSGFQSVLLEFEDTVNRFRNDVQSDLERNDRDRNDTLNRFQDNLIEKIVSFQEQEIESQADSQATLLHALNQTAEEIAKTNQVHRNELRKLYRSVHRLQWLVAMALVFAIFALSGSTALLLLDHWG